MTNKIKAQSNFMKKMFNFIKKFAPGQRLKKNSLKWQPVLSSLAGLGFCSFSVTMKKATQDSAALCDTEESDIQNERK